MADYTVTLTISESVYARAQQIAAETAQPIEQVLVSRLAETFNELSALPADEQAELMAFRQLSDDTLRGIAREQLPRQDQERMIVLGDKTSRGTITADERREYEHLVERSNRLILRKAWAAGVLMDRGQEVGPQDFAAQNG